MNGDTKNIQVQIHLAEYSALRAEMLSFMKWRDSIVFISLSISGAIFSFAFSHLGSSEQNTQTHWAALYLVAPLSTIVGGLWVVNGWKIMRISEYLEQEISPKLNILLRLSEPNHGFAVQQEVMQWESSDQKLRYKWKRRSIEWFIYLTTFVLTGTLSQLLLLRERDGTVYERIKNLEFPLLYITNNCMLLLTFCGFLAYLLKGFKYKAKPKIHFK